MLGNLIKGNNKQNEIILRLSCFRSSSPLAFEHWYIHNKRGRVDPRSTDGYPCKQYRAPSLAIVTESNTLMHKNLNCKLTKFKTLSKHLKYSHETTPRLNISLTYPEEL